MDNEQQMAMYQAQLMGMNPLARQMAQAELLQQSQLMQQAAYQARQLGLMNSAAQQMFTTASYSHPGNLSFTTANAFCEPVPEQVVSKSFLPEEPEPEPKRYRFDMPTLNDLALPLISISLIVAGAWWWL